VTHAGPVKQRVFTRRAHGCFTSRLTPHSLPPAHRYVHHTTPIQKHVSRQDRAPLLRVPLTRGPVCEPETAPKEAKKNTHSERNFLLSWQWHGMAWQLAPRWSSSRNKGEREPKPGAHAGHRAVRPTSSVSRTPPPASPLPVLRPARVRARPPAPRAVINTPSPSLPRPPRSPSFPSSHGQKQIPLVCLQKRERERERAAAARTRWGLRLLPPSPPKLPPYGGRPLHRPDRRISPPAAGGVSLAARFGGGDRPDRPTDRLALEVRTSDCRPIPLFSCDLTGAMERSVVCSGWRLVYPEGVPGRSRRLFFLSLFFLGGAGWRDSRRRFRESS
jgi:hypothetical protein